MDFNSIDLRKVVRCIVLTNSCGEKFQFSIQDIADSKYISDNSESSIRPPESRRNSSVTEDNKNNNEDPGSPIRPPGSRKYSPDTEENKNNNEDPGSPIRPPGSRKYWPDVKLTNSHGEILKFTIQKVPKDRYDEILKHTSSCFLNQDIVRPSNIHFTTDLEIMKDIWKLLLENSISIAAFLNEGENNFKLAAVNILLVMNNVIETANNINNVSNEKGKSMFSFFSVHPAFYGLGLDKVLMKIRNEIEQEFGIIESNEIQQVLQH